MRPSYIGAVAPSTTKYFYTATLLLVTSVAVSAQTPTNRPTVTLISPPPTLANFTLLSPSNNSVKSTNISIAPTISAASNNITNDNNTSSAPPTGMPTTPAPTTASPSLILTTSPTLLTTFAPTISLKLLHQTNIEMILLGVARPWTSTDHLTWITVTEQHILSFWNNFSLSPYFVPIHQSMQTKIISVTRLLPNDNTNYNNAYSYLSSANSKDNSSGSNNTVSSASSLVLNNQQQQQQQQSFLLSQSPLRIVYNQSILFGLKQVPLNPYMLPPETKLFTLPFTTDQVTYVETLAVALNNNDNSKYTNASVILPILVSSVLIMGFWVTTVAPTAAPVSTQSQDMNIIIITTVITVFSLLVAGGYIIYLTQKENADDGEEAMADSVAYDDEYTEEGGEEDYNHHGREESAASEYHHPTTTGSIMITTPTTAAAASDAARASRTNSAEGRPPKPQQQNYHQQHHKRVASAGSNHTTPSIVLYDTLGSQQGGGGGGSSLVNSEMDTGSSISTARKDTRGSSPLEDAATATLQFHHSPSGHNPFPSVSTLPISVISGYEGRSSGGPGVYSTSMHTERGGGELDESQSSQFYNYPHHRRRFSSSDAADMHTHNFPVQQSTTLSSSGIASQGGLTPQNNDEHDQSFPHLMSGFQMKIEDLDDI